MLIKSKLNSLNSFKLEMSERKEDKEDKEKPKLSWDSGITNVNDALIALLKAEQEEDPKADNSDAISYLQYSQDVVTALLKSNSALEFCSLAEYQEKLNMGTFGKKASHNFEPSERLNNHTIEGVEQIRYF